MKRLTNVALAGAIALGGLGVTSVADIPGLSAETAEASVLQDDYNGVSWKFVENNMDPGITVESGYETGDTFNFTYSDGGTLRYQPDHVKIYRIGPDGNLQRYKTIEAEFVPGETYMDGYYDYSTPITTGYYPGTYVAVHTYNFEYAGGNVAEEQTRSITFKINQ